MQVGARQAAALAELGLVRALPGQYKSCLAEAVRRRAYATLYAGQAEQLAERMGAIRNKEVCHV